MSRARSLLPGRNFDFMSFLLFNRRLCLIAALIQLIGLINRANASDRIITPLDDESTAQLDALEAQLRAEMHVTTAPTFNYGYYPYNLAIPAAPYTPVATQTSLWNPLGRPPPFAVAYGSLTRPANTPLNFDMIKNHKKSRGSKIVDADVQSVKSFTQESPSTLSIDSNLIGEAPAGAGENIFVDALKQVLVSFKRGMMSGKYGTELQQRAERLNHDVKNQNSLRSHRPVDDGTISTRPHQPLSHKWEASAVNGRFNSPRDVDATAAEFRRKPITIRQLYPTYTILPSRLTFKK